jgi:hypothetical protein
MQHDRGAVVEASVDHVSTFDDDRSFAVVAGWNGS